MPYNRIKFSWSNACMLCTSLTKSSNAPGWFSVSFFRTFAATGKILPVVWKFRYCQYMYTQGMNQYSSRSIQYSIPILVKKSKNTQYFNTFFAFWKYWKYQYHYQYPILSFSSDALILQCFLVDLFIFINQTVLLGYKLRSSVKTKDGREKIWVRVE